LLTGLAITGFNPLTCEEKGKHSDGACSLAEAFLTGARIDSRHTSKAKLKVTDWPNDYQIFETLKGSLKSVLTVTSVADEALTGTAKLKIKSSGEDSTYGCLLGIDGGGSEQWGHIQACIDSPGPNNIDGYFGDDDGLGLYFGGGPVFAPTELHIVDNGSYKVKSKLTGTELKGKIQVTADAPPPALFPAGFITITKTEAQFAID